MEHGIGGGSSAPGCQARSAEGVMVRRLSVASRDSGAESLVYGEESSASAGRNPVGTPLRVGGAGRCRADGFIPLWVPHGVATRDITVTMDLATSWQVGTVLPRLATTCDMSVVDPQSGRWYVKDIRASTQPMGTP
jgi:hypothetical protein